MLSSQPNKEIPISLDAANLMKLLWNNLVHFSFRYTKDEEASEDIVQSVFLKVHEDDRPFTSFIHAKKFLYVTVKNKSFNYLRDLANEQEDELQYARLQTSWEDEDTQNLDTAESFKKVVLEVYPLLSDENKRLLRLCFWKRLSTAEVCRITGFSAALVYKRKQRLREIFQNHLTKK